MSVVRAVPVAGLVVALVGGACGGSGATSDARVRVAVTTEILADLVARLGGERVVVTSIVPPGGDPHAYEPTPGDVTKVASADVAFTNHLLLEDHPLIKLFDANVREGVPNVSLAENAERYGANLLPLVEDVQLDVVWLGLAVRGAAGVDRSSDVRFVARALDGPGDLFVWVTDALGRPEIHFDSSDGLDGRDAVVLPPGAHAHVNWAFTRPGVHRLRLAAEIVPPGGTARELGEATFAFAVGVDPREAGPGPVISEGHADLAVDLSDGRVFACTAKSSCADEVSDVRSVPVVEVPNHSLTVVPDDDAFAFLGPAGTEVWQLPQVVLGKHVHGVVDPHAWLDVKNARAYVELIARTLVSVDPAGAAAYEAARDEYVAELDALDAEVARRIATIPESDRDLVTAHDAFGYLAAAYGLRVAGFVVPNPAQEPSALEVRRLTQTIRNLDVPAVFVEPNLAARSNVLRQVARDLDVEVCTLYADAFGGDVDSYVELMRHNASELARCLGGAA